MLRRYKKIIQWLLAAGCLIYIVAFFRKNSQELQLLTNLNPLYLIALASLIFLGHLIFTYRFHMVLKKCTGKTIPFWHWFKMVILGRFLSTIAPQAGNIYRSITLKQNYQIPHAHYAGSLFAVTWMDAIFNFIIAGIILLLFQPEMLLGGIRMWLLLLLLAVGLALVPIMLKILIGRWRFHNPRIKWLHNRLSELLKVSLSTLGDGPFMFKFFLIGIISFINAVAAFYLCFGSLGIQVNLSLLALFYVILKLSNQIMITPGNLGIREIAYGLISQHMQIGMTQGILVSVLIRLISTIVIIILGFFLGGRELFSGRRKFTQIEGDKTTSDSPFEAG